MRLPAETALWIGGAGAVSLRNLPDGVDIAPTLDDLDRLLAQLSD